MSTFCVDGIAGVLAAGNAFTSSAEVPKGVLMAMAGPHAFAYVQVLSHAPLDGTLTCAVLPLTEDVASPLRDELTEIPGALCEQFLLEKVILQVPSDTQVDDVLRVVTRRCELEGLLPCHRWHAGRWHHDEIWGYWPSGNPGRPYGPKPSSQELLELVSRTDRVPELPPRLTGRFAELVPFHAEDWPWLYSLFQRDGLLVRSMFDRNLPSPEEFVRVFDDVGGWRCIIRRRGAGSPAGLVFSSDEDLASGHAQINVVLDREMRRRGWPIEGALLFAISMFGLLRLEKVYFHVIDALEDVDVGLSRWGRKEAVLRRHLANGSDRADVHIYALYRRDAYEIASTYGLMRSTDDPAL